MKSMDEKTKSRRIKHYADRMNVLIAQKTGVRDLIRALQKEIKNELGYDAPDFSISMRLANMAIKNQEKTLVTVKEVLTALGAIIPNTVAEKPRSELPTQDINEGFRSRQNAVLLFVRNFGPVKAVVADKSFQYKTSQYLSKLKKAGLVKNDEQGQWIAT